MALKIINSPKLQTSLESWKKFHFLFQFNFKQFWLIRNYVNTKKNYYLYLGKTTIKKAVFMTRFFKFFKTVHLNFHLEYGTNDYFRFQAYTTILGSKWRLLASRLGPTSGFHWRRSFQTLGLWCVSERVLNFMHFLKFSLNDRYKI